MSSPVAVPIWELIAIVVTSKISLIIMKVKMVQFWPLLAVHAARTLIIIILLSDTNCLIDVELRKMLMSGMFVNHQGLLKHQSPPKPQLTLRPPLPSKLV